MRILLSLLLSVLSVGGVCWYLYGSGRLVPVGGHEPVARSVGNAIPMPVDAEGQGGVARRNASDASHLRIELLLSSAAAADAYASSPETEGLEVIVNGQPATGLFFFAGERHLCYADGFALREGENEIVVDATPDGTKTGTPWAVRVRIVRQNRVFAETTLWAQGGGRLTDAARIRLDAEAFRAAPRVDMGDAP